jgi:hypothetical protein
MKSLYLGASRPLVFKCRFGHLAGRGCGSRLRWMRDDMMRQLSEPGDPGLLSAHLRDAHAVTTELLSEIIRDACRRFPSLGQTARTARIERLIAADAWVDAALALIELELPQWQIRRIAYDEGEWHCALSRARELPEWLDQSIEAHHEDLTLAILVAFVEIQRISAPSSRTSVPAVPLEAAAFYEPACCDHFA